MTKPILMDINHTVFLSGNCLHLLDRRLFPQMIQEVRCYSYEEVAQAIQDMVVQGAGDIAIAAGYGLYLAGKNVENAGTLGTQVGRTFLQLARNRLIHTRPTGFHLKGLLDKMMESLEDQSSDWPCKMQAVLQRAIKKQQNRSESTGKRAAEILKDGDTILTHCFPGAGLLYMLQYAQEQGKEIKVIATETRPYLQGARLTAWGASELGIPVTLISDNMAAYCMSRGMIDKVFTAADRIAMDGTIANKVGTFQIALAAKYHQIPMYILGYGGPDRNTVTGDAIPIEFRDPNEVLQFHGIKITADKVAGFYPAFDLTPGDLVQGIITDKGMYTPAQISLYWSS